MIVIKKIFFKIFIKCLNLYDDNKGKATDPHFDQITLCETFVKYQEN